ncbi:MAG: SpoIID/LytB domain-containing protein [Geobacteraceae bacterium]
MHTLKIFWSLVIGILFLPAVLFAANGDTETIRVAVQKGKESIRINGVGLVAVDSYGNSLSVPFPLVVKKEGSGISAGGVLLRSLKVSSPGFVQINDKGYRGHLEVYPSEQGLLVVDEMLLEDYLVGLINCEISSQWPIEAVKAQAVVARTFALFQKQSRKNLLYHLESTVYDQVYGGSDIEDSRAARAVSETRGEVVDFNGKIIQAFFHSSCGGHTEASHNVWSVTLPYLRGVDCSYCMKSPSVLWELALSPKKIETLLRAAGYSVTDLERIQVLSRYPSGRITKLELASARGNVTIPAVVFRKIMGYGVIRSTDFEVKIVDGDFVFVGTGYGHGVGLCQWGAKQRAEEGFSYREILSYYYPGTRLVNFYTE